MWASCYYWLWLFPPQDEGSPLCCITLSTIHILISYFVSSVFPWFSFHCFVAQFSELFLLANTLPLPRRNGLRDCNCCCFKLLIKELVKAGLIKTVAAACLQKGSHCWQQAVGVFKNTSLLPAGPRALQHRLDVHKQATAPHRPSCGILRCWVFFFIDFTPTTEISLWVEASSFSASYHVLSPGCINTQQTSNSAD